MRSLSLVPSCPPHGTRQPSAQQPGPPSGRDEPPARVRRLAQVARLIRTAGPLYLLFGEGPAAEVAQRRRDGESGCLLPGLSADPLHPEPWWDRTAEQWIARQLCQYAHLWGGTREGWVVSGHEVGRGPDCEPLLTDVRVLAVLAPECLEEASVVYRSMFARARR